MLRKKTKRKPLNFVIPIKSKLKGSNSPEDINRYIYTTLNLSIVAKESSGRSVFLKPDGTAIYVLGSASNAVHSYTLGTAFKIDTGVFAASFDVTPNLTSNCYSLFFKPDGTVMYAGGSATDTVCQYNLGVAWDITSAVYAQNVSVAAKSSSQRKIAFSSDGLAMYVLDNSKSLFQYTLGAAWDISTAVYTSTLVISAIAAIDASGLAFSTDGKKMYVNSSTDSIVHQYNLSTAWDITTAAYTGKSQNMSTVDSSAYGCFFSSDMVYMYMIGSSGDKVYEFKNN